MEWEVRDETGGSAFRGVSECVIRSGDMLLGRLRDTDLWLNAMY